MSTQISSPDFQNSEYLDLRELLIRTTDVLFTLNDYHSNVEFKKTVNSIPNKELIRSDSVWKDSVLNWIMFTLFIPVLVTVMLYIYDYLGWNWLIFGITTYLLITAGIVSKRVKNRRKRKAIVKTTKEIKIILNNLILHFKEPQYLENLNEKKVILNQMKNNT